MVVAYSVPFSIDYVDLNGYAGEPVTATSSGVGVTFDKTAPSITTLSYSSDNSNLATMAKADDVIAVNSGANCFKPRAYGCRQCSYK